MSRIGKSPIVVPEKVTVNIDKDNVVTVKGPKGTLSEKISKDIKVEQKDGELILTRPTDQIRHRSLHGLSRALIANMVEGVTVGFKKEMELIGVGFRASVSGQQLDLSLGFSHNIIIELPEEIKAEAKMEKGKPPLVILESYDKQLLGHVAAKIRSLRKPEPYKGKGIKFVGEEIRRKAGKTAGA